MQVYLVGGAVRDGVLGLPIKDKDFVVVGTSPQAMLAQGFMQVGADFPVFLHPKNGREYALARTERKTGKGYLGFQVNTTNVSLEDDLSRRDLTINAMAIQVHSLFDDTPITDAIIDPYGGLNDLANRQLRHVSEAFREDPLRVLRVARFYARFYDFGFQVYPSTALLMQEIASSGELALLSRERLWTESIKALEEKNGFAFFELLYQTNILEHTLPELTVAWQNDALRQRTFLALQSANHTAIHVKFALLVSTFLSTEDKLEQLDATTKRLLTPNHSKHFAHLLLSYHDNILRLHQLNAKELLTLIEATKAHKDAHTLMELIDTVAILHQTTPDTTIISDALASYRHISIHDVDKTLTGKAIGDELTRLRLLALKELLDER